MSRLPHSAMRAPDGFFQNLGSRRTLRQRVDPLRSRSRGMELPRTRSALWRLYDRGVAQALCLSDRTAVRQRSLPHERPGDRRRSSVPDVPARLQSYRISGTFAPAAGRLVLPPCGETSAAGAVGCARRADRQLPYLQRPATREDSLRRSSARTDRLLRSAHTPYPLNPYNIMNDDTLIVTETEGDTFDLQLSESSTPETFRAGPLR
mgnify:CR=1 FL=1